MAGQAAEPLDRLRSWALAQGKDVLARDAPYPSPDELELLSLIAQQQRRAFPPTLDADKAEAWLVWNCARALLSADIRLPYTTVMRAGFGA